MVDKINWKEVLSDENLKKLEWLVSLTKYIPGLHKRSVWILDAIVEIRVWRKLAEELNIAFNSIEGLNEGSSEWSTEKINDLMRERNEIIKRIREMSL